MKCQQIRNITDCSQLKQLFKSRVLNKENNKQNQYYSEEIPKGLSTFATLNYLA